MVVERLNRRHARVKLPKLGWVKFRLSRSLDDVVLRSATLTRDGTHWFVSFLVDDGHDTPAAHAVPGTAVGVDRGVVVAIATSDGELLDRRLLTPGEQDRMARLQRQLSRCGRRGSNRDRIRAALAEIRAPGAAPTTGFLRAVRPLPRVGQCGGSPRRAQDPAHDPVGEGTLEQPGTQCGSQVRA